MTLPAAQRALVGYAWPGNVRELENRLRRALLVEAGDVLDAPDLGFGERPSGAPESARGASEERAALEAVIVRHEGRVSQAAEELGLSRQALYRRMERLGITLERRPRD